MAERGVVATVSGAVLRISAGLPATYDAAGYGASSLAFTNVGSVENFGNRGMTANVPEFTPIDTAVGNKMKGSKNYGTMSMTFGYVPTDAGQAIVEAASESNSHYSLEIQYEDLESHYFDVIVSKFEFQDGAVDDVRRIAVDFAICRRPVIVPAP